MSTSKELEQLKQEIRKLKPSRKRGDLVYEALELWLPLQIDDDWLRLLNDRTKDINQREVAAEVCATDNIWKTERFKQLLESMRDLVKGRGLYERRFPYLANSIKTEVCAGELGNELTARSVGGAEMPLGDGNPILERQIAQLNITNSSLEGKLSRAEIRIRELEKRLAKYESLGELNRALSSMTQFRC